MRYRQKKVNANDFLRELTYKKDVKPTVVSELCGYNRKALGRYINQDAVPSIQAFETFLDYFGYELLIIEKPRIDVAVREAREKGVSYGTLQGMRQQRT